jgi:hypothetical protein
MQDEARVAKCVANAERQDDDNARMGTTQTNRGGATVADALYMMMPSHALSRHMVNC